MPHQDLHWQVPER